MHNYQIKEFTPKSGQNGTHSFYVEAKPFQTLDNLRIAQAQKQAEEEMKKEGNGKVIPFMPKGEA